MNRVPEYEMRQVTQPRLMTPASLIMNLILWNRHISTTSPRGKADWPSDDTLKQIQFATTRFTVL